jgi:hypothetical protein
VSLQNIADDEVLFRRIPPGTRWFEPPNRITSANFKLRKNLNELGLSLYRASKVSPSDILHKPGAIPDSLIAQATVGNIRKLTDGNGKPLGLDVVVVNDENDPGHAEIRGPVPGVITNSAAQSLRQLFKIIQ